MDRFALWNDERSRRADPQPDGVSAGKSKSGDRISVSTTEPGEVENVWSRGTAACGVFVMVGWCGLRRSPAVGGSRCAFAVRWHHVQPLAVGGWPTGFAEQ